MMLKGSPFFSDSIVLKVFKNQNNHSLKAGSVFSKQNIEPLKISAIAPKKPFPTAVERNKARRKVYSTISLFLKKNLLKKTEYGSNYTVLCAIICNRKLFLQDTDGVYKEIEQVFKKSGIL